MSSESTDTKELEEKVDGTVPDNGIFRPDVDTSGVDERKLMRRIDWHVVPWLALLYLLSSLDRGSIGNARLYHLQDDLHISDKQYLIALTVFFFPYALFEPPSNIALKQLRPSRWISFIMFVWGVAMTMHGFVRNYSGLIGLRFLLGISEAGLYPGVVFYMSCWYKRSELGTRVAVFFTSATVAGAFSGLLAAAISNMDGIGGKPGWAWIFILEGLFTVICAVLSFWILQDFPDNAKFLSETERVWVVRRMQGDMKFSAGGESFKMRYVWQSLKDLKTWVVMVVFMGTGGGLSAFSLFTPTIINQVSFKATAANLLSVPVYAWACIVTLVIGFLGDRIGHRGYIHLSLFGIGLIGYIILISSTTPALSYFAVYLAASDLSYYSKLDVSPYIMSLTTGNIGSILNFVERTSAWVSSNVEGSYKRSTTLAMAIGWGNLNGAVTSNVYRARDKPFYRLGHGIVLAYLAIGWLSTLIYLLLLKRENALREAGKRDEVIQGVVGNKDGDEKNGVYESVEDAKREKGDEWSGFRYTL